MMKKCEYDSVILEGKKSFFRKKVVVEVEVEVGEGKSRYYIYICADE